MKRLRENPAARWLAALLLAAAAFVGSYFGLEALRAVPFLDVERWDDLSEFRLLLERRENQLTDYAASLAQLKGTDLTYLDRQNLEAAVSMYEQQMAPDATAFRYQIRSADGQDIILTNLPQGQDLADRVNSVRYDAFFLGNSGIIEDAHWSEQAAGILSGSGTDWLPERSPENEDDGLAVSLSPPCIIECGVDEAALPQVNDEFSTLYAGFHHAKELFPFALTVFGLSVVTVLACLLFLLWAAGHRKDSPELVLSWQERIPFDLYLLVIGAIGFAALRGGLYLSHYFSYVYNTFYASQDEMMWLLPSLSAVAALLVGIAALVLRTLIVRLKAHALIQTTLSLRGIRWCWRLLRELAHNLPLFWKTVAGYAVFSFLNWALFTQAAYDGIWALLWMLLHLSVLLGLCWWSLSFQRLRAGSRAIAAGDMEFCLETAKMPHDLKAHAEDLNNISTGLSAAVENQMKSERFKAELITNVSHDLKTPLTSIISYVDLLKTTEQTDPKALEYIEVLDRKSQRLKKLTEDLVEASKASTGVLTVNRERLSMGQLLDQAMGEWTEKLEARSLTVVTSLPEGETWVYADGRHLWRVVDNLLSNCAKYAMEGTRIYLDLSRGKGQVSLSVKNISREPLNVPPERLLERFVRGEESRTTEGSGLGLSIARSLTELQGGTFELAVDGDLFKAVVTLPQAN